MSQRKIRNHEEREAVCRGIVDEAVRYGFALDSPPMHRLYEVFERFTQDTHGGDISGRLAADEIRKGSELEFVLPGRRIKKPVVRLVGHAEPAEPKPKT
jgi:hypothetical protein